MILTDESTKREYIKTTFDKNFVVEAGAGSGKSTLLTDRIINQLSCTDTKVSEIVAITFTKKAAGELTTKIQDKLRKAHEANPESEKLKEAVENIESLFIGTIHSFCSKMLRERPFEAGLCIEFSEMDSEQEKIFKSMVWNKYIQSHECSSGINYLNDLGINISALEEMFYRLCEFPDIDVCYEKNIEKPDGYNLLEKIFISLEKGESLLKQGGKKLMDELRVNGEFNPECYKEHEIFSLVHDFAKLNGSECFDKRALKSQQGKNPGIEALIDELDFLYNESERVDKQWKGYCYTHIMDFLLEAQKQYEAEKKRQSIVTFTDLLIRVRSMLKNNLDIRLYYRRKYKCFYVDEFQDTDPIQAEILFYLTAKNPEIDNSSWYDCQPVEGSLFVVGDPKQAIYRFRRADISIYNKVKELISNCSGKTHVLNWNYRSNDKICKWVEGIFLNETESNDKLFPRTANEYQAAFEGMTSLWPSDNTDSGLCSGVYRLCLEDGKETADEIVEKDADSIAEFICNAVNNKSILVPKAKEVCGNRIEQAGRVGYQDFMILTYTTGRIEKYLSALNRRGIPVSFAGKVKLGDTPEVRKLLYVLRAVDDPQDEIKFAAALKNTYGVADLEILEYKKDTKIKNFSYIDISLVNDNTADGVHIKYRNLIEGCKKLSEYYNLKSILSPIVIAEKIIEDTRLIRDGDSARRLLQTIEILKRNEAGQPMSSFCYFVERLEQLTNIELENELPLKGEINAVRVMNLHKAKGLEASIVFLANPTGYHSKDPDEYIERTCAGNARGHFRITNTFNINGASIVIPIAYSSNWDSYMEEEKKFLYEEKIRLLYVAATRAQCALIISDANISRSPNPWKRILSDSLPSFKEYVDSLGQMAVVTDQFSNDNCTPSEQIHRIATAHLMDLSAWVENASKPSYLILSPSMLKKERAISKRAEREVTSSLNKENDAEIDECINHTVNKMPFGTVWGNILHRVFELVISNMGKTASEDVSRFTRKAINEYVNLSRLQEADYKALLTDNLPGDICEAEILDLIFEAIHGYAQEEVNAFLKSEIGRNVKRAQKVFPEMPFSLKADASDDRLFMFLKDHLGDLKVDLDSEGYMLVTGIIDLVLQVDGRWVIVDYKTNTAVGNPDFRNSLIGLYKPQLEAYKLIFESLTGEVVTDTVIYSTALKEGIQV